MATPHLKKPATRTARPVRKKELYHEETLGSTGRQGQGPAQREDPQNGSLTQEQRLAIGLGWFGIGIGLAELIIPRRLARTIGVPSHYHGLIRAMGLREIASGVGILSQRRPTTALWSRVAGDAIDLACLGAAFILPRADRGKLATATVGVVGATMLDVLCAQQLSRGVETRNGSIPLTVTLAINRTAEELYRYWRDFSNLPQFMRHLESVEVTGDRRSHWVAKGPAGSTVEWDAEITDDRPNEAIAWRSLEGADVDHAGSVRFEPAPGGRGTFVTVEMQYRPPLGTLGAAVAAWFGEDPNQTVKMDLRRFKQVLETGEVITTEGQPAGRAESTSWKYDAANAA